MSVCSSMGCSSRERLSWRNKPAHLRHCLSLLSWPYMDQARSQRLPAGVTSQPAPTRPATWNALPPPIQHQRHAFTPPFKPHLNLPADT